MQPEKFIIQKLEALKNVKNNNIKDHNILILSIYKFLVSKKFRKYALTPGYEEHILSAIKNNIKKNEPIKLSLVFGGYKLWRLDEAPEVDWAELFSLIYYTKWLKPILEIYPPGIWFDFFAEDGIIELMNNVSKKDTNQYIQSFKKLLDYIKFYIPPNLHFTLNRVVDQYQSYDDFIIDLDKSINEVKKELENTELTKNQIAAIELNVKLKSGQDNDPKWREKINLIHEGYSRISKRRSYYRTADKIMIATKPIKNSIAIGTTKTSVAKFWVGVGALKKLDDNFIEYIFSPSQLENAKFEIMPIWISGLSGKNFDKIRILN